MLRNRKKDGRGVNRHIAATYAGGMLLAAVLLLVGGCPQPALDGQKQLDQQDQDLVNLVTGIVQMQLAEEARVAVGPPGLSGEPGSPGSMGEPGADGGVGPTGPQGSSPFELVGDDAVYTQGNVGIGTDAPATRLTVEDFRAVARINSTNSSSGSVLQIRNSRSNDDDPGRIDFMQRDIVSGSIEMIDTGIFGPAMLFRLNGALRFGIDITGASAPAGLFVDTGFAARRSAGTVATFDRTTNDGTVISIKQNGTQEGSITVFGSTVSYNAFTGSHYAWIETAPERGTLLRMTGENRRAHDKPDAEPIYGVEPTGRANDPACLGAYLSLHEPSQPVGPENPHLVMAAGNGDMWVTDAGGEIRPGDALISSNIIGCAMKDDPSRFAVGHAVARAAETVRWSDVAPDAHGVKRKRISVLFGGFLRGGSTARLEQIVRQQAEQIDRLARQVRLLSDLAARLEQSRNDSTK